MKHIKNFDDNEFGIGKPKNSNFKYVVIKPSNKFSESYNKFICCHIATVLEKIDNYHIYVRYDEDPYRFSQHFIYDDIKYYSNNKEFLDILIDSENYNL